MPGTAGTPKGFLGVTPLIVNGATGMCLLMEEPQSFPFLLKNGNKNWTTNW
jgi:hypothetical protein